MDKKFNAEMTVAEVINSHPRAREVMTGYHLGGCSHCAISEFETLGQVADGYSVPIEMLLESLESLFDASEAETVKSDKIFDANELLEKMDRDYEKETGATKE